ncbi:MAG: DUF6046 domain-containing protein [Flavobacterium circumlabens]|uniref:DUF6046 domain-containing protein n=1 Tax=Flavobacterium circumlabens TaxID=2133765 RepID=UPI003265112C
MSYTIPNLFLDAFGLKVNQVYRPELSTGNPDKPKGLFSGMEIAENINESFDTSSRGTAILFPIDFSEGNYKKYNDKGELINVNMGDFRLPIASVVSFRRDKIMSQTKINGGRGSVKEVYGFDDWQVTINGFLIPDNSQKQGFTTPLKQEKELVKWDNLASSIEVFGELFTLRRITNLAIKGITFEPMRGKPNIRTFTINALSDESIELNIKSGI